MDEIKLGITQDITTNFENLICPHCHATIDWDTFYSKVDTHDVLSTNAAATHDYTCPECKSQMRVCLDVLVQAEKL